MTPRLQTRNLCHSFGGLAVTQNVTLSLPQGARTVIMESTYGDRTHGDIDAQEELYAAIPTLVGG